MRRLTALLSRIAPHAFRSDSLLRNGPLGRSASRQRRLFLEPLEDRRVLSTFTVVNTDDNGGVNPSPLAGTGTLRQAIVDANASDSDADLIQFDIPGAGVHTIRPITYLPVITGGGAVVIDGTTQPGFSVTGQRLIEVSGTEITPWTGNMLFVPGAGLDVWNDGSIIRGIAVSSFTAGIRVGGTNALIEGNFIGTDATGSAALPNRFGVWLLGANNRLGSNRDGSNDDAERNVISGNSAEGVELAGHDNVVAGNYIGTNATGMVAIANVVGIRGGELNSTIAGNLISGNSDSGLNIAGNNLLVQGNLIGTDMTGNTALPNHHGIFLQFGGTVIIGGTTPEARNIISGNRMGIRIDSSGSIIQGNFIGRSLSGADLGNESGIYHERSSNNLIGGRLPGEGNVISGNGFGILLAHHRNGVDRIEGNLIVNNRDGVVLYEGTVNQVIGGTAAGAGNTIAFNGTGVVVAGTFFGLNSNQNRIVGNSIHDNHGLGIDLGQNGFSPNDVLDSDTGANEFQNFPALIAASSVPSTRVQGSLHSTPDADFVLDFYASSAADPSGYGEGERWLGSATVTTNTNGNATFDVVVPGASSGGEFITATATDSLGNTSEFSLAIQAPVNSPPTADAGGPYTIGEGGNLQLDGGGSSDPEDGTSLTYEWDLDYDGFTFDVDASGVQPSVSFPENFVPRTIALRVTDSGELSHLDDTATIEVTNVAPHDVTIAESVGELVFAVGSYQTFSGSFEDVGTEDTHTSVWSFTHVSAAGVTVTETRTGTVTQASGSGTVSDSFAFTEAGVYQVTLTVTDDDDGATSSLTSLFVVYNPSAGFVTGGGWINSPAGAYAANPALSGKANFGFVSRYQNGNNVPTGNTEFQFKVADFNFKSTSYEWLVVSDAKARFRGVGTVNGAGGYAFELTAWDGQSPGGGGVDKFRIKIWLGNQGSGVVYDNMLGASDGANPTTALGGGSIVIHKSGNNLVLDSAGNSAPSRTLRLDDSQLSTTLADAVGQLAAQGLSSSQIHHLQDIQVVWADLPGNMLGLASESTNYVWIDRDAAGYGWSLSSAPQGGRVDLFSTLTHELGHMLGYRHDVLGESLQVGERNGATLADHRDHYHTELGTPLTFDAALLAGAGRLFGNPSRDVLMDDGPGRHLSRAAIDLLDQAVADWSQSGDWAPRPAGNSTVAAGRSLTVRERLREETNESLDNDLLAELAMEIR